MFRHLASFVLSGLSLTAFNACYAATNTVTFTDPAGADRAAIVATPDQPPAGPLPLVVLLHGGNLSPTQATASNYPSSRWLLKAAAGEMVVAVPWGTGDSPGAQPNQAHWNDCVSGDGIAGDDAGAILTLIDLVKSQSNIDATRIYLVGSSNGGEMAMRLAAERSDLFAAVASVSGLNARTSECLPPTLPVPVMIFAGTADNIMPYDGSKGTYQATNYNISAPDSYLQWTTWNGISASPNPTTVDLPNVNLLDGTKTACTSDGLMRQQTVLCTITGGGHTEPSIAVKMSLVGGLLLGKQSKDFEYSDFVWEFFKLHQLGVN